MGEYPSLPAAQDCICALFLMALLSFGIAIAISGCGGDGFFNQPPHAYAITVKATSGALQHTTTVNLTVQ